MTTPEPPEGERPSLQDRLAAFEFEPDYDDEYDDDPAGEAALPVEEGVTSYDDSAFAAVGDQPSPYAPVDPADVHDTGEHQPIVEEPEPSAEVVVPAEDPAPEPPEDLAMEPSGPAADDDDRVAADDTVSLEQPGPEPEPPDPFAAAPTALAAVPVDALTAEAAPTDAAAADEQAPQAAAADEAAPGGGRRAKRERRGRRLTLPVVALLIMTALMAAATAYLWLQVRDDHRTEQARRSGLEASRDAARLLFSYDYRTLDKDFKTGRALTTGEFRKQYDKTTTKVVADVARQYKAVVKANVVGAGVVRATPDEIVAVVYVNQVTTSTRVAGEKVDLSRVRMTLRRSGDEWLVTSVNAL
jgi:Mce-associated membrane protein